MPTIHCNTRLWSHQFNKQLPKMPAIKTWQPRNAKNLESEYINGNWRATCDSMRARLAAETMEWSSELSTKLLWALFVVSHLVACRRFMYGWADSCKHTVAFHLQTYLHCNSEDSMAPGKCRDWDRLDMLRVDMKTSPQHDRTRRCLIFARRYDWSWLSTLWADVATEAAVTV